MEKIIRFAVIGCGRASGTHIYAIQQDPFAEVVAVVDKNTEAAQYTAKRFGIKQYCSGIQELLAHEDINAVSLVTSNNVHAEHARFFFDQGIAVLTEKPLAATFEEAKELVNLAAEKKVPYAVMLQRRFYHNTQLVKELLTEGVLGAIKKVTLVHECYKDDAWYQGWKGRKEEAGGGVLLNQALHSVDRLVHFFGPVHSVESTMKLRPGTNVEEIISGTVIFKNGVQAEIFSTSAAEGKPWNCDISIDGERGNLLMSSAKTLEWNVKWVLAPEKNSMKGIPSDIRPDYYGPCHEQVINNFIHHLLGAESLAVPAQEALASMELVFAFYDSAEKGEKITFA